VGIYFLTGVIHLQNADLGLMFSILTGIFILLCAYGAIGLFVSCLTSYQVVAAISTFIFFAALNYLAQLWQDIDFVRDLTYSMSLAGRINKFGSGLISTKDVAYFAVIIGMFLSFSILRLQGTRSTDNGFIKGLKYAAVAICGLVIGYITARPTLIGYWDTTATKTQTLTANTQKILKDMGDEPVEVTSYINLLDYNFWQGVPAQRNTDIERWEPYIRFKPNINLKYVYFYDTTESAEFYRQYPKKSVKEIAETFAKSFQMDLDFFKSPEEIKKIIDLRPEENRYVMQLKYKGKSTFLRLFDDPLIYPTERETGAALKRLIRKVPTIAFLEGELERSALKKGDRDYRTMTSTLSFRYAMMNQGFDFTTVSLKDGDIPANIDALVIADPRVPFEPVVLAKIQQFIDKGGNLLIAGEPGKQAVLNPVLDQLGIQMKDGMIVQKLEDYSPSLAFNYLTNDAAAFSKTMDKAMRDSAKITTPNAAALLYNSTGRFTIKPMLMTDEKYAWNKSQPLSSDSIQVNFNAGEGDEKSKYITMAALTRKLPDGKEQRIIVSGDADFMSSMELRRGMPATYNFRYNTSLFGWLSNDQFPIDVTRPDSLDQVIRLKGTDFKWLKILFMGVLPFILFLIGTIILVRRKKK
jgi:ABC-2 type transport system permease protein